MPPHPQRQAAFAVCYFSAYVGYLFLYQEHELLHWLSLVLIPLMALSIIGKYPSRRVLLESVGVGGGRATRGMTWVIVLGVAFQVLQLLNSRQRRELVGILREPLGFLLPLGALVLLIGTVATTEEVFFRGILQSRLSNWIRNEPVALVLATIAFALYHLPYAYLNPAWPSAGNFSSAVQAAAANGVPAGLALGFVYWRSGRNLLAPILLHAFIDLIPATRLVHGMLLTPR